MNWQGELKLVTSPALQAREAHACRQWREIPVNSESHSWSCLFLVVPLFSEELYTFSSLSLQDHYCFLAFRLYLFIAETCVQIPALTVTSLVTSSNLLNLFQIFNLLIYKIKTECFHSKWLPVSVVLTSPHNHIKITSTEQPSCRIAWNPDEQPYH